MTYLYAFLHFYLFFVNFIHKYEILHHIQSRSLPPSSPLLPTCLFQFQAHFLLSSFSIVSAAHICMGNVAGAIPLKNTLGPPPGNRTLPMASLLHCDLLNPFFSMLGCQLAWFASHSHRDFRSAFVLFSPEDNVSQLSPASGSYQLSTPLTLCSLSLGGEG